MNVPVFAHRRGHSRQEFLYHLILSVIRDSALTSLNVPAKAIDCLPAPLSRERPCKPLRNGGFWLGYSLRLAAFSQTHPAFSRKPIFWRICGVYRSRVPKRFAAETVSRAISAVAVMQISPAPFRG